MMMNNEVNLLVDEMKKEFNSQQRLKYVNLTSADCHILKSFQKTIIKHADRIVDEFYKNITGHPELDQLIKRANSNVERLKKTQKGYLIDLFSGQYDDAYFDNQFRIGAVHKAIGLTPQWYLGGYSVYLQLINPLIIKKYWYSSSKALKLLAATNKIISLDSQITIDTYIYGLVYDVKNMSTSKSEIEQKVALYSDFIERVGRGDLTQKIEIEGEDDLASLGRQINHMVGDLSSMTSNIHSVGAQLVDTIDKLNSAAVTHSSGATEQASAITQTTSTLEDIRATSQQTQSKAQDLGEVAENIRIEGQNGIEAFAQVIESMDEIRERVNSISQTILALSEKTQQIGNINNVISNLTQQSKMLALNASIEAAKAGDAGRGFAVVATEVRELAEQSQQSTEQVHKILRDIQLATDHAVIATEQGAKGVDKGEQLVHSTSDIMHKLNSVIHESVISSQQIVAAVRQEGAGISQVSIAMNEINKVTIQFVMAAEQTKSVYNDLVRISEKLQKMLSVYKHDL